VFNLLLVAAVLSFQLVCHPLGTNVADADIIFLPWFLRLLPFFLSSRNLSRRRLDVDHTSTHGVALMRI